MSNKDLSSGNEIEDIDQKYKNLKKIRKGVSITSTIAKVAAYSHFGTTTLGIKDLESIIELEGFTEFATEIASNSALSDVATKFSESFSVMFSNIATDFQTDPYANVIVLSAIGACIIADKWNDTNPDNSDLLKYQLKTNHSDFHKALSAKVNSKSNKEYKSYAKSLASLAKHKHIVGEGTDQHYEDSYSLDDVSLQNLDSFIFGASEIAQFVIDSDTELAAFIRDKCDELCLNKSSISSFLSSNEIREHLVKKRSDDSKAHVFINEYIDALSGLEKRILANPNQYGDKSIHDQITSIKQSIIMEAKDINDANLVLNAFSKDAYNIIKSVESGNPITDLKLKQFQSQLAPFINLSRYKSSGDNWRPFYESVTQLATTLSKDLSRADGALKGFREAINLEADEAPASAHKIFLKSAPIVDKSDILVTSNKHSDFTFHACQQILQSKIAEAGVNKLGMSKEESEAFAKQEINKIDTTIASLEISEETYRHIQVTRKNDNFILKLGRTIAQETLSAFEH